MKRKIVTKVFIVLSILVFASLHLYAASLWDDNNPIYADHNAYQKGDILTVVITENADASHQASTNTSQSSQAEVGAGRGILDFITSFGVNQNDSDTASGETSRSGSFTATITVQVIEVLDNGNLKISGTKFLNINDEKEEIELTGIIRKKDINPNNTVDSRYIADANINYEGKGAVGDKQKPGIITRILNWFF